MKLLFKLTITATLMCIMASCHNEEPLMMSTDQLLDWHTIKEHNLEMTVNGGKVSGCKIFFDAPKDESTDKLMMTIYARGFNPTAIKLPVTCTPTGENTMHLKCSEDFANRCHYDLDGTYTYIPAKGLIDHKANLNIDLNYTVTSALTGKTVEFDMKDNPFCVRMLPAGETTINGETMSKRDAYTEALRLINEDIANKYAGMRMKFGDDGKISIYTKLTENSEWELRSSVKYWWDSESYYNFTIPLNDQVKADIYDVWIRRSTSENGGSFDWWLNEYLTLQIITDGKRVSLTAADVNHRDIIHSYQYYINADMGYYPMAKPSDEYIKLWPVDQTEYIEQFAAYLCNSAVSQGKVNHIWSIKGIIF